MCVEKKFLFLKCNKCKNVNVFFQKIGIQFPFQKKCTICFGSIPLSVTIGMCMYSENWQRKQDSDLLKKDYVRLYSYCNASGL